MATFQLSPGVNVTETDLTNIIPAVATAIGGSVGKFRWGPAFEPTLVSSEAQLLSQFGYPTVSPDPAVNNRLDWYAAANFLSYSNSLQLVRIVPQSASSAASEPANGNVRITIAPGMINTGNYTVPIFVDEDNTTYTVNLLVNTAIGASTIANMITALVNNDPTLNKLVFATQTAVGGIYNNVLVTPTSTTNVGTIVRPPVDQTIGGLEFTYTNPSGDSEYGSDNAIYNEGDFLNKRSGLDDGSVYSRFPGALGNGIGIAFIDANVSQADFTRVLFGYDENVVPFSGGTRPSDLFATIPGTSPWAQNNGWSTLNDEMHVVVYTTDTTQTGVSGQVLETYSYLSKAKNALDTAAQSNYYVDVINAQSQWVYLTGEDKASDYVTAGPNQIDLGTTISAVPVGAMFVPFVKLTPGRIDFTGTQGLRFYILGGATDGKADAEVSDYLAGWDLLGDSQLIDVNLLVSGNPLDSTIGPSLDTTVIQKYVMNIAETRKDAVAFISPGYNAAVNTPTAQEVYNYFNNPDTGAPFNSSSYAFFDSGWKQQYDRYNDEYFWMPLSPDMAGLSANTSAIAADWFSPAGYNRGFIKNVVKLSYNPNKTDRDLLYPGRINPVITERGQGTLLLGDRTALTRPSAFDRINVRRLFIVLEKAIATAAKFQLFEFNDEFTRANFVSQVEPFLQDIQSRRGLTQFLVKSDASNNTPQVIASNRFVADIYVRPNYSINFITLNFIAVGPNVEFTEIAGQ